MYKRLISIVLMLGLLLSSSTPALAVEDSNVYPADSKIQTLSVAEHSAGAQLTGNNKILYQHLSSGIEQIATGARTSTLFNLSIEDFGLTDCWTAADLQLDSLYDGDALSADVWPALMSKASCDFDLIVSALTADYPFSLYWFDKLSGIFGETTFSVYTGTENGEDIIYFSDATSFTFVLAVAEEYAGETVTVLDGVSVYSEVSTEKCAQFKVSQAQAEAQRIVAENADKSDYEKLLAYKQAICDATDYNTPAAQDPNIPYGNPWQAVYVFDGDPETTVVCEGYSKAFQYLCDLSDFEDDVQCYVVTGLMAVSGEGEAHMWNIVQLSDGSCYLVDITNCDDYSIGAPDYLFLAGADSTGDGDANYDIGITVSSGDMVVYAYDDYTHTLWDDMDILELSAHDYIPPQSGTYADFDYIVDCLGAVITKYLGSSESVTVPAYIDGYPVTQIASGAFSDNNTMKELIISEGIQTIPLGNPAFINCSALETIQFPSTLVFGAGLPGATHFLTGCYAVKEISVAEGNPYYQTVDGILFSKDGTNLIYCPPMLAMETYTVPDGVTTICTDAFSYNKTLQKITLPNTVKTIDYFAFECAASLQEINLPEGLEFIGQYAFHATSIKTLALPSTLTVWQPPVFQGDSLETITVSPDNPVFYAEDNVLFNRYTSVETGEDVIKLVKYAPKKLDTAYTIPDCVTALDEAAFFGAQNLTSVTLNKQLKTIPHSCFFNCLGLKSIVIPSNIERIEDHAFANDSPAWIRLENDAIVLDQYAFMPYESIVIYANPGSTGQAFAEQNNNQFADIAEHHNFTNKASSSLVSPATCLAPAVYKVQCDFCDLVSDTLTVTVGEPDYDSHQDTENDAVCDVCGVSLAASHTHIYSEPSFSWNDGVCTADYVCTCGEHKLETMTFTLEAGSLKLSHIPGDLLLLAASYEDGHLIACELLNVCLEQPITVSGSTIKVFILNKLTYAPLTDCLVIQ